MTQSSFHEVLRIFESNNESTSSDHVATNVGNKNYSLYCLRDGKQNVVKGMPKMDKDIRIPILFQGIERNATKEPRHAPRTCIFQKTSDTIWLNTRKNTRFIFLPLWDQLWAVCAHWINAEIITRIHVVVWGGHLSLIRINSFCNLGLQIINVMIEIERVIRYGMPCIL